MSSAVRNLVESHSQWLGGAGKSLFERATRALDQDLGDNSFRSLLPATVRLSQLATFYGISGVLQVLQGDEVGWQVVHRSVRYRLAVVQIHAFVFTRQRFLSPIIDVPNLTPRISTTASLLCYGISFDDLSLTRLAHHLLQQLASTPGAIDPHFWAGRRFEPFARALGEISSGANAHDLPLAVSFEPFCRVLAEWSDPGALVAALEQVLAYHVENMVRSPSSGLSEFAEPPFDLVPAEVLAVFRLQQRAGVTLQNPEHEFWGLPTARLREAGTTFSDNLLSRVEELLEQYR